MTAIDAENIDQKSFIYFIHLFFRWTTNNALASKFKTMLYPQVKWFGFIKTCNRPPNPITLIGHSLSPLKAQQGLGVGLVGCEGLQEHHLYSRTNFKLNRAAALAEWRQLLSA